MWPHPLMWSLRFHHFLLVFPPRLPGCYLAAVQFIVVLKLQNPFISARGPQQLCTLSDGVAAFHTQCRAELINLLASYKITGDVSSNDFRQPLNRNAISGRFQHLTLVDLA